jgi:hypothetical protein
MRLDLVERQWHINDQKRFGVLIHSPTFVYCPRVFMRYARTHFTLRENSRLIKTNVGEWVLIRFIRSIRFLTVDTGSFDGIAT